MLLIVALVFAAAFSAPKSIKLIKKNWSHNLKVKFHKLQVESLFEDALQGKSVASDSHAKKPNFRAGKHVYSLVQKYFGAFCLISSLLCLWRWFFLGHFKSSFLT